MTVELFIRTKNDSKYRHLKVGDNITDAYLNELVDKFADDMIAKYKYVDYYCGWRKIYDNSN